MKNSLNLTQDEISCVLSALETYAEAENPIVFGISFREPLRTELIQSALSKLENISILTYFSTQEITVMLAAVYFILDGSQYCTIDASEEELLLSASKKLSAISDISCPLS